MLLLTLPASLAPILLFLSVALNVILVFLWWNSHTRNKRANALLRVQNQNILKQWEEKEALIKEIHHRVKNNLQVINSLLRLQSQHISDPKVIALFEECQNRVISMALIHEQLYVSVDHYEINVKEYIEALSRRMVRTYGLSKEIHVNMDVEEVRFDLNTLIPLGLLMNEILSNSLKYAFPNSNHGSVTIRLHAVGAKTYELVIGDNGIGMDRALFTEPSETLGVELIKTFTEQLDGTIERLDQPGTMFKVSFTEAKKSKPFN